MAMYCIQLYSRKRECEKIETRFEWSGTTFQTPPLQNGHKDAVPEKGAASHVVADFCKTCDLFERDDQPCISFRMETVTRLR